MEGYMSILWVQPDFKAAWALIPMLQTAGIKVTHAESLGEAAESAKSHPYDAVVLEIVPSGENTGLELIEIIREHIGNPHEVRCVPIVVFSSDASIDTKVAALELGANDYLTTPLDPRELIVRIERHVDSRDRWRLEGKLNAESPHGPRVLQLPSSRDKSHLRLVPP